MYDYYFFQIKMMNTDGSGGTGSVDDQQMISIADRENYITRL